MTILDHIGELRTRIIRSILAVLAGAIVAWLAYDQILDVLLAPYCETLTDLGKSTPELGSGDCRLYITEPTAGFQIKFKVALYGGVGLAMPFLMWQIWRFVTPALKGNEKRFAVPFIMAATSLFACGVALAYWSFPRALDFLLTIGGDQVDPLLSPDKYLSFITFMLLAFGIGFQFPILLAFLQIAGIVTPKQLSKMRRFSIVGIITLAAIITPGGDPPTLFALSIPLWLFYELAIVFGWFYTRRRR